MSKRMYLQSINENKCITESGLHAQILKDWTLTYDQISSGHFESFCVKFPLMTFKFTKKNLNLLFSNVVKRRRIHCV